MTPRPAEYTEARRVSHGIVTRRAWQAGRVTRAPPWSVLVVLGLLAAPTSSERAAAQACATEQDEVFRSPHPLGADGAATIGSGRGGLAAAGGPGGINSANAAFNGLIGGGIGTGTGGNGGVDATTDTGGGGGGGYTGGGGGASTVKSTVTGAGGGGGSSFVRGTSPTVTAPAPTTVSGAAGPSPAGGAVVGPTGFITIDWVPCVYTLAVTKAASAPAVNAGQSVRWTITVRNDGPDPMTKGDLVTLTDTLPNGGGSVFQVVSVSTTAGSTDPNLASGAVTCTAHTLPRATAAVTAPP